MILAKIWVSGTRAIVLDAEEIPMGISGGKIIFEYADPIWNGLTKTVVLRGVVTKDVLNAGNVVEVPPEVVSRFGTPLHVGVYGTEAEQRIIIPTLWADLGRIRPAADPSGDASTDPALPVWAQLEGRVKRLELAGPGPGAGGGVYFETDETLSLDNGILSVNTTDSVEQDNTLPITSAGVFATVGNIEALLKTI